MNRIIISILFAAIMTVAGGCTKTAHKEFASATIHNDCGYDIVIEDVRDHKNRVVYDNGIGRLIKDGECRSFRTLYPRTDKSWTISLSNGTRFTYTREAMTPDNYIQRSPLNTYYIIIDGESGAFSYTFTESDAEYISKMNAQGIYSDRPTGR